MKCRSELRLSARASVQSYEPDPESKKTAKPSNYLSRLSRIIREERKRGKRNFQIVRHCRVSSLEQERNGNLCDQINRFLRSIRRLEERLDVEIEIIGKFEEVVSAWKLWASERPELVKAAKWAQERVAILVTTSTCRFLRNRDHADGVLPTVEDFANLRALVGNVQLATLRDPDDPPESVRSAETKRGQKSKGRKGGTPKAVHYRLSHYHWPKALRNEIKHLRMNGWKYRELEEKYRGELADKYGLSKSAIQRYLAQFSEEQLSHFR